MHTQIEIVRCPLCGAKVFETVRHDGFRAGGSSIGPSSIPCPGCGTYILTGQSEWDDKTLVQRLWFIIHRVIWLLVSSVIVAGGLALIVTLIVTEYWFLNRMQQEQCRFVAFCVGTALLGIQFFRNSAKEIRESRRRTRSVESA